jgi:hypothetical protein
MSVGLVDLLPSDDDWLHGSCWLGMHRAPDLFRLSNYQL